MWVSKYLVDLHRSKDVFEVGRAIVGCKVHGGESGFISFCLKLAADPTVPKAKTLKTRPASSAAVDEPHPRPPRDKEVMTALISGHKCLVELCSDIDLRTREGWQRHTAKLSIADDRGIRKLVTVAGAVKE